MCMRTEEEVGHTVGLAQRRKHFLEFFNVSVQAPTRGHPFYGYSEKHESFDSLEIISIRKRSRSAESKHVLIVEYFVKQYLHVFCWFNIFYQECTWLGY